jgi:hypothetical protein
MKLFRTLLALVAFASCGGGSPPAESPKPHAGTDAKPKEPSADDEPGTRRSGVQCDDGSCFACGEAVCLRGFYCAVGRSGRGCAWVPSCPGTPSCACLSAALREEPSCACEEKEGGVYVVCDGAKL